MAYFQIDGTDIPTPTTYGFSIEDLSSEETGRTLDGEMHKDVVSIKDTYTCTWERTLSSVEAATLLNLVDGKTEVILRYIDPRHSGWLTNRFYIGKREGEANNLLDPAKTWKRITLQFIRI